MDLSALEAEEVLEVMGLVARPGDWGCFRMGRQQRGLG